MRPGQDFDVDGGEEEEDEEEEEEEEEHEEMDDRYSFGFVLSERTSSLRSLMSSLKRFVGKSFLSLGVVEVLVVVDVKEDTSRFSWKQGM